MSNVVYNLTIKNDKRIIPEIAEFISKSAEKLGLDKKKVYFLCFTLETVLEYRTSEIDKSNDEINIQVSDNGRYFKFTVTDLGKPYVLTKNQIAILNNKLVDKYSFEQNGRKGQSFSFTYKYDSTVIEPEEIKEEQLLDEEFSCRKLTDSDDDILAAIRCLYDSYGYEYYHQNLYSVEAFRKYMSNGRYVPVISSNKHNQTMGYCALDENEWFSGVPELSNLVTKPIARGKGLATQIFKETEDIAKELNYEGIQVQAVAYHPYTQKMCNKLNYTPCAIEYSINPAGTGGYDADRRLDCVIGIKIFNKTSKHILYLNDECNDMFNKIYSEEKLNYEIVNKEDIKLDDESILSYFVDNDTSNCFFKLDKCNKDIKEEFDKLLHNEEIKDIDVLTVNLNMNNESSILGYNALRELGFICVGCIPACKNGDFMILQKYKVQPEFEKIVALDNYKELINEIYRLNGIKGE